MKIDAHQHFWIYNEEEYGWIKDSMQKIRKNFLPDNLRKNLINLGFDGCITIQARQTMYETKWLLELADTCDFIQGVVGWVDLQSNDVDNILQDLSQNEKFVGVRHVVHDEMDDQFMLNEKFLMGISFLKRYNLTYDFLLFPKHLPVAYEVALKFPKQKFVVDHISKPFIKDGIIEPWSSDIKKLASLPNVYCKLSGMVTEADRIKWNVKDFYPYLDIVLNAFGEERVMIGSDWPVCLLGGTYSEIMGIVMDYIETLSFTAQTAILGGNCERFYLN
jgi:L-fuconolactonase